MVARNIKQIVGFNSNIEAFIKIAVINDVFRDEYVHSSPDTSALKSKQAGLGYVRSKLH